MWNIGGNVKLLEKLMSIRGELDYMQKDTKGYNYKYVSGFSMLSKINAKMNELKLLLYPEITSQEFEVVNTLTKSGQKTEVVVKSLGNYIWVDTETGDELKIGWSFTGMQSDASQAFGSGLTYAERYFLLKFFNVPTDEADPDKIHSKQQAKEDKEHTVTLKELKESIDKGFKFLKMPMIDEAKMREEYLGDNPVPEDYDLLLKTLRNKSKNKGDKNE